MDDEKLIQNLEVLSSTLMARSQLLAKMGKSFGSQRDIYYALGYIENPVFNDYYWRYTRTSMGKRIVQAYPIGCWQRHPQVQESQDPGETPFEKAWTALEKRLGLFYALRRVDILAGIGQYGILLLGFNGNVETPLRKGERLLYMRPLTEDTAQIGDLDENPSSERYGKPLNYKVSMKNGNKSFSAKVHHSRVLHIAEDAEENDYLGTPRLKAVLNDLQSLDLVVGGSGEMFWRGAFPGYGFVAKEGAVMPTGTAATSLDNAIEDFVHNLRRYLKLTNVDIHDFSPQVASPAEHFDTLISSISAGTGIPKRILIGSERGELASQQDRDNWGDRVAERQRNFCEPMILRPFVDKLIEVGELPKPTDYIVSWPPIQTPDAKDTATTAKAVAEALNTYASGPAETVVPQGAFLQRYLNFSPADVEDIEKLTAELKEEYEQKELEEFEREMAAKPVPFGGGNEE
jgi:hypothetical protein